MPRTSVVHYIAPSAISITPNANGSANDLAVYVARGAKIKVYSPGIPALGWENNTFQEWTLRGRNRRLTDDTKPYTIYARLPKSNKANGYLVFAPKDRRDEGWQDKYCYVTQNGLSPLYVSGKGGASVRDNTNWWIKLGEVSLPENNQRTVTLDTGILGTVQYNNDWSLNPDELPLRIELDCSIDGEDAGNRPYVAWGKELIMRARLVEGWTDTDVARFDHWEIRRNTGDESDDARWNALDRSTGFRKSGNIALSHARGVGDDFNGAVSTTFTIIAMGTTDESSSSSSGSSSPSSSSSSSSSSDGLVPIAAATLNVMAETVEQYALELSTSVASYDPTTDVYSPIEGIKVTIRATDQKGNVFKLTRGQMESASLAVQYALADSDAWATMEFTGAATALAESVIDIRTFYAHQNVNVRIVKVVPDTSSTSSTSSSDGAPKLVELYRTPIAFVRNGEDSREREWIYLRSEGPLTFGEDPEGHLLPALIEGGQVEPAAAATGLDTNKQQDGWVPEGWWDEMQGTNEQYHYEYGAYRDWIRNEASVSSSSDSSSSGDGERSGGHWGEFTTPRIWSYYAEDAVTYRCRWTLNGVEVFQLKAAYTGAFRGTLPLVATLMKRVGNNREQEVTALASIVTVAFDGLSAESQPSPYNVTNPQFTIGSGEDQHPEFVPFLSNVGLQAINITFTVGGESHPFSIPVIREADEDSVKDTIDEYGSTRFLSKVHNDTAAGLIAFLQGLKIGDLESKYGITGSGNATFAQIIFDTVLKSFGANPSFIGGNGIHMDASTGHIATDSLDVRGWMRIMELIINRLQLMESDYSFTEGATTEHFDIDPNGNHMTVTVHKEHDNDYLPFYPGDILYAKINDLLPAGQVPDGHTATEHGSYYTVWVRVLSTNMNDNTMVLVPYLGRNAEGPIVPGAVNFTPQGMGISGAGAPTASDFYTSYNEALQAEYALYPEGYDEAITFTRHGNVADGIDPATGLPSASILSSQKNRQQAWVLSTTDKRLTFFWNVDKPIVDEDNYALCLGILPQLSCLPYDSNGNPVWNVDMPSLFVNTVFYSHMHRINWPAKVVKEDRGQWTATPKATYTGVTGTRTPDGTLDSAIATALGWTGTSPLSFTEGQEIDEPYHFKAITRNRWISMRLSAAHNSLSDATLYKKMTKEWTEENDLETSRVWNYGILWECTVDGTSQEPCWGCANWQAIGGDIIYYCEIMSSAGTTFRNGNVDTILSMSVRYGQEDITTKMSSLSGASVSWSRYTGFDNTTQRFVQTSEDKSWTAVSIPDSPCSIRLSRSDLGSGWMVDYRLAMIHCSIYAPDGDGLNTTEYPADYITKI